MLAAYALLQATANQSQGLSNGAAPQERAAEERRVYEGLKEDHWRRSVTVTGFFLLVCTYIPFHAQLSCRQQQPSHKTQQRWQLARRD